MTGATDGMTMGSQLALLAQAGAGGPQGDPNQQMMYMVLMFGVIFLLFYLLILRPQKREQKRQEDIRNAIKKGDKVITIGGVHGTVAAVDTTNGTVAVQVDRNVKIDFSRSAIATVITKDDKASEDEPKK